MPDQQYDHKAYWKYKFPVPALYLGTERCDLKKGQLHRAVGVDGRYSGLLRRFPGFKLLRDCDEDGVQRFWPISIQKGTSKYVLRGFLIWCTSDSDPSSLMLRYHLFDTELETWSSGTVIDWGNLTVNPVHPVGGPVHVGFPKTRPNSNAGWISGLAYDPETNVAWAILDDDTDHFLVTVDPQTGQIKEIVGDTTRHDLIDMTYDTASNVLYATSASSLYTINKTTGAASAVGAYNPAHTITSIFWAEADTLYALRDDDVHIYTVNQTTAVLTDEVTLDTAVEGVAGYSDARDRMIAAAAGTGHMRAYNVVTGASTELDMELGTPALGLAPVGETNLIWAIDDFGHIVEMVDLDPPFEFDSVDVSCNGRYAYVVFAVAGSKKPYNIALYWDGSALVTRRMGAWQQPVTGLADADNPLTFSASGGILLGDARVNVAFRYVSRVHGIKSPLSGIVADDTPADAEDDVLGSLAIVPAASPYLPIEWDEATDIIEIWRTIAVDAALTADNPEILTNLYLERGEFSEQNPPYDVATGSGDVDEGFPISDNALTGNRIFDFVQDHVGIVPRSGLVLCTDDQTFLAAMPFSPGDQFLRADEPLISSAERVMWSPPEKFDIENFRGPVTGEQHRFPDASARTLALHRVGDFVLAITNFGVVRYHKSGSYVAVNPAHSKWGCVARDAVTSFNNNLFVVTPNGLMAINAQTMEPHEVGAVSDIFAKVEYWRESLDAVQLSYDAQLGVLWMFNPDEEQAYLLWSETGAVTSLDDMAFLQVADGILPEEGGTQSSFWITADGKVYVPNFLEDADRFTMADIPTANTVNGEATGGTTTTLVDSGAAFSSRAIGHYVYFLTGDNSLQKRQISAVTGTELTWVDPLDDAIVADVRYSVAPIPFRIQGWPLEAGSFEIDDIFRRRIVTGLHASVHFRGGETGIDNVNRTLFYRMFKGMRNVETSQQEKTMWDDQSQNYVPINMADALLFPEWECLSSDLDFSLLSGGVSGRITTSEGQTSP